MEGPLYATKLRLVQYHIRASAGMKLSYFVSIASKSVWKVLLVVVPIFASTQGLLNEWKVLKMRKRSESFYSISERIVSAYSARRTRFYDLEQANNFETESQSVALPLSRTGIADISEFANAWDKQLDISMIAEDGFLNSDSSSFVEGLHSISF